MEKQLILSIIEKNINVHGLAKGTLESLLKPALDELVKSTETPIDDMLADMLYDKLVPEILNQIVKQWSKLDGQ